MYSIYQWCGRFGNNIQQISNALYYCKKNKLNFSCPDNDLINSFQIKFGNENCEPNLFFFSRPSITNQGGPHFECDEKELKLQRKFLCKYIYPNLKINFNNIKELDNDTVVAHIRSGDIFNRKNYYCPVISRYIQNPLKYYLDIISKFKKCIILTEDYNNPVLLELSKLNNIEIKILPIQETIEIMLSAKNLISSGVSSFSIACGLLSKNLENFFTSNIIFEEALNNSDLSEIDVHITELDLNKYMKNDQWLNTEEQRQLMISYE